MVNSLSAAQLAKRWRVGFEGEDGQDEGGVHADLLTQAFQDFEAAYVNSTTGEFAAAVPGGAAAAATPAGLACAEAIGRLAIHALALDMTPQLALNPAMWAAALGRPGASVLRELDGNDLASFEQPPPNPRGWLSWGEERRRCHLAWLAASDPSGRERTMLDGAHEYGVDFTDASGAPLCRGSADTSVTADNLRWYQLFILTRRFFGGRRDEVCAAIGRGLRVRVRSGAPSPPPHHTRPLRRVI